MGVVGYTGGCGCTPISPALHRVAYTGEGWGEAPISPPRAACLRHVTSRQEQSNVDAMYYGDTSLFVGAAGSHVEALCI